MMELDDTRRAILDTAGHLLIEGGPGSGKTTTAHSSRHRSAPPAAWAVDSCRDQVFDGYRAGTILACVPPSWEFHEGDTLELKNPLSALCGNNPIPHTRI